MKKKETELKLLDQDSTIVLPLVEHPNMFLTPWSILLRTINQVERDTDDHCMTIIINQDSDTVALNVSYIPYFPMEKE